MNDLKRLFGYMGPYRRDMALGMLLVVVESAFEMVIPILMSDIIDQGVSHGDVREIMWTGVEMAICAVLALITGLLYARYAARASYGFGARIRDLREMYRRLRNPVHAQDDGFVPAPDETKNENSREGASQNA